MTPFRGKLVKDGQAVADNIDGRLTIDPAPDGSEWWSGFCTLPGGQTVSLDETFDLVLDDGRSGKVRIERVNAYPHGTSVSFAHG
jgi:hypothetical protein